MWRCPRKLIFSRFGVPSATPAHENSASTGPPHSSIAASIDASVAEVHVDRLRAREGDLGEVHHHDLGAGVEHQLGDRGAHAGGTTDDHGALAVVSKRAGQ